MLSDREEALKDLKKQLDKIKENNRQQIHLITLMADDYSEYADDVAKLIIDHIKDAPSELKLIGIYVMDSIIKFSGDTVERYRRLFGNEIVKLFVDTFEKAPIAHRQSLFKVRSTWQAFFLKSKLFDLDNEIQKIDKSWPIFKQSAAGIPIIPSKSTAIPPASTSITAKTVTAPQQAVVKSTVSPAKLEKSKPGPAASKSSVVPSIPASSSSSSVKSVTPVKTSLKPVLRSVKQEKSLPAKQEKSSPAKHEKSQPISAVKPPTVAPKSVTVSAASAPPKPSASPQKVAVKRILRPIKKEISPSTSIAPTTPAVTSKSFATLSTSTISKTKTITAPQQNAIKRVLRPLKHDKSSPALKKNRRNEDSHPVQPTAALGSHAFLPPVQVAIPPSIAFPMPPQPSISPLGGILPPQIPKTEIEDSWRSAATMPPIQPFNQPPPPLIINSGPPPLHPSSGMGAPSVITNETPRFGGASNNRIFVDGRAYEVLYLNNEAIIEQNGLPHRIFFSGPPRDILIDGKPFKLGFDEVRMIHIDNVPHPIRFGAPSRELYVGEHPFRGAFGGPPMVANINGRRHEFRLCGPPPEVRIDQDPCYELSRHMNAVRAPQSIKPKQEEKLVKEDVIALLKKIKQHGILNKPLTVSKDGSKTSSVAEKPSPPGPRIDVGIAREISAPPSIKDFQIGTLMVRYSEVIEALHRPRTACPHCGIGFTDTNSEAYQRHIDMHVQDLLRTKESGKSRSRTWFMGKENWLEFDELSEVQKQPTTELLKGTAVEGSSSPKVDKFTSSPSDAIATTSLNKVCSVCHEKFNEYYDNDDEEWRFQDCVVKGNVAIHRYCVEQMEDGNANNGNVGIKQEVVSQKPSAFPV